jgi:GTP-binding protein
MAGRHVRLYYVTQAAVCPPTFFVSCNHPDDVGLPYRRYLVHQFRATYGFEGTPLRVALRARRRTSRRAESA